MILTDEGQISVDFLMGISLFLLTFAFVIQFIPSLFISVSEEGSLNSVAYRTANILSEDPGWWENSTLNGTDWEMHTENISRIGLAADITPGTRQTETPRMLNKTKIQHALRLNEIVLTRKLGLYDKISGSQVDYGYNITLQQSGNIMVMNGSVISFGEEPPVSQDIIKITRQVLVETGNIASIRFDELTNEPPIADDNALINISGPQSEDVIIQIIDFNIADPITASFKRAKLNGSDLNITSDYIAYKRTNISDFFTYSDPLNHTDTLRLIFNHTLFPFNTTYQLELNFAQMSFIRTGPPYIEYTAKVEPLYEPASLVLEVWK
ncbi:MAG: hypothetical protein O8C66_02960 [Candidatus Methanoperedens sp.]|nr:hypothetical protein [Candidatus Methanoperedens sp.]MCZ7369447.1 hypothetical protein [Candidatus Methanoperedens sp.]